MLGEAGEGSRGLSPWGSTFPICPQAQEIPGVKIFRSSSTLYFANVEMYAEALKKKVGAPLAPRCPPPVGTRGVTGSTGLCCLVERHQRGPPDREEEEGPQEAEEAAEESGEADGREEKGASLPREPPVVPPCPPALPSPALVPAPVPGCGAAGWFRVREAVGQKWGRARPPCHTQGWRHAGR